jgi:2-hydroxy-3-oxopropionate reductase
MSNVNSLPQIGFLGTGSIGQPIIRNLLKAGYPVAVWNRTPARYADLLTAGATATATPRELAAKSDVLIAMLMEPAHLDALLDGPDGILAGMKPGSIFIDMGTNPPRHAQLLAKTFAAKSVDALDTPVQGGVKAALDGTLAVMVGGKKDAYERVLPMLQTIGKTIVYVGEAGSGQLTKLCHQIVCAVTIEALAESFALAKSFGADGAAVREVLMAGLAAGPLLKNGAPKMISGDFTAGRPMWLYDKDRTHLAEALEGTSLKLPIATEVFERMHGMIASGSGDLDETALYTLLDP